MLERCSRDARHSFVVKVVIMMTCMRCQLQNVQDWIEDRKLQRLSPVLYYAFVSILESCDVCILVLGTRCSRYRLVNLIIAIDEDDLAPVG
jgi:hypothetical protein